MSSQSECHILTVVMFAGTVKECNPVGGRIKTLVEMYGFSRAAERKTLDVAQEAIWTAV